MNVTQRGKFWHYRFMLDGKLYRGSTEQTTKVKAQQFMMALITKLREGTVTPAMVLGDAPLLSSLAATFLKYAREKHKAGGYTDNGLKHYERGVKMLKATPVWAMRIDRIRSEDMEVVQFKGPASANNCIRVLRRILSFAESKGLIFKCPRFKLREENVRTATVSPALEALMLKHATNPTLHDALIFGFDSAMRPAEICAIRWEDVNWQENKIYIPKSKTKKGRRFVGMTSRMRSALQSRQEKANGQPWVFPSNGAKSGRKAAGGHTLASSLDKMWTGMKARVLVEIEQRNLEPWPAGLVFYSSRHTGATRFDEATGNAVMTADFVGHADTRTTRRYIHHDVDSGAIMDQHRLKLVKKGAA
jgi:integrase